MTCTKRLFPAEYLIDDLELPDGNDQVEVLDDRIIGEHRWTIERAVYFRLPGMPKDQAWRATYETSKTEEGGGPWAHEYERDEEVECILRIAVPVTEVHWAPYDEVTAASVRNDASLTRQLAEARLAIFKAMTRLREMEKEDDDEAAGEVADVLETAYKKG
jgi:hypothetical protein